MSHLNRKLKYRIVNEMRAIEANARVSKVLLNNLKRSVKRAGKQLNTQSPYFGGLESAVDGLIEESIDMHTLLADAAPEHASAIDEDSVEVILVIQCCGGK